jgi:phosphoribosyl 1,2-cyclic phosphodiesterase
VQAGGELLVFDLGSGLRGLGRSLSQGGPVSGHLFLSHYHWDHIAGLPFFSPAYDPHSELAVHGPTRRGRGVRQLLSGQMIDPYFPVELSIFRARMDYRPIEEEQQLQVGGATIHTFGLNHPGGSVGYRIEAGGRSIVYATDFEHGSRADDRLVEMATGADLLIFDSQYLPAEYDAPAPFSRKGWGHSTYEAGAVLALRARVKQLALFHHEPDREDAAIDEIAARARALHPGAFAACEGLALEL